MNVLIESGIVKKMDCGGNVAYVVNDNSIFSATEYKVLQSQSESAFVKCMKFLYNGNIQLFYCTSHLKSLTDILYSLDPKSFMIVVSNILSNIISVKTNGFLFCESLDVSLGHIYVDPNTYKIELIYLPLSKRLYTNFAFFESELRTSLVKLIQNLESISSSKTMKLASDLSNGRLSLEDVYFNNRVQQISQTNQPSEQDVVSIHKSKKLKLVATNSPRSFEIVVTKEEFKLGKKRELVDGVIDYNAAISRCHCKIVSQNGEFTIIDLNSVNGTYVNGRLMQVEKAYPIKNGDRVQLADSEFRVSIE